MRSRTWLVQAAILQRLQGFLDLQKSDRNMQKDFRRNSRDVRRVEKQEKVRMLFLRSERCALLDTDIRWCSWALLDPH